MNGLSVNFQSTFSLCALSSVSLCMSRYHDNGWIRMSLHYSVLSADFFPLNEHILGFFSVPQATYIYGPNAQLHNPQPVLLTPSFLSPTQLLHGQLSLILPPPPPFSLMTYRDSYFTTSFHVSFLMSLQPNMFCGTVVYHPPPSFHIGICPPSSSLLLSLSSISGEVLACLPICSLAHSLTDWAWCERLGITVLFTGEC